MKIIKDLRILKAIERKHNIVFDRTYKYCLSNDSIKLTRELIKDGYRLKYFSGCFYPYLVTEEEYCLFINEHI